MIPAPRDNEAVWLAQLAEMPLKIILTYLRERGILSGGYYRQDMLPPGYPPWADYDDETEEQPLISLGEERRA